MRGLKGKVALITGGSKNIGRAITRRLALEGVAVAVVGRDSGSASKLLEEIGQEGGRAKFIQADISLPESALSAVEETISAFGGLDIIINNAAATERIRNGEEHSLAEEELDTFDYFMKVGLYAPFLLAKAAIPRMLEKESGVFVNISSTAACHGQLGSTVYGPSKAAIESLSKQIAANYGRKGIRSVAVRVGLIRTDDNQFLHDHPEAGPLLRERQMLATGGKPDDIASAVAFLASEEAAFVTGTTLEVDGGIGSMQNLPDLTGIFLQRKK